jgi:hypothetical protein
MTGAQRPATAALGTVTVERLVRYAGASGDFSRLIAPGSRWSPAHPGLVRRLGFDLTRMLHRQSRCDLLGDRVSSGQTRTVRQDAGERGIRQGPMAGSVVSGPWFRKSSTHAASGPYLPSDDRKGPRRDDVPAYRHETILRCTGTMQDHCSA